MANKRKFDHEEAYKLHKAGWTYMMLMVKYKVNLSAIWRAIKRLEVNYEKPTVQTKDQQD